MVTGQWQISGSRGSGIGWNEAGEIVSHEHHYDSRNPAQGPCSVCGAVGSWVVRWSVGHEDERHGQFCEAHAPLYGEERG